MLQGENGAGQTDNAKARGRHTRSRWSRRDVVGCRMPGSSAGEGHAPRSHIAHKRNNEESYVNRKGRRKIHIPPPHNPSHAGSAPSADKAVVLATEPKEHTTRGEERENGMDGEGRGQRAPRRKQRRRTDNAKARGRHTRSGWSRRNVASSRMPGSSAGGGGTRRGHTSHTSDTTKRAKSL